MKQERPVFVLSADNQYMDKLETTIKSICCYHNQAKFYVFNDDIATEWFQLMNRRLGVLGSEVVNVKLTADSIKRYRTPNPHINYATYFRYFIADYVQENRVLYLDSDLVVTGSLSGLFELDLEGYPVAAVEDAPFYTDKFNAGVLLVDTGRWRQQSVSSALLELTNQHHEHAYGDQEILNMYFANQWKKLDLTYNLQVGNDAQLHYQGYQDWYTLFDGVPLIVHYTTINKPWSHFRFNRFRELWWFYYGLNWNDILLRNHAITTDFEQLIAWPRLTATIFTNSGDIESLETLLQRLPDVRINVAAPTLFSPNIVELQKYENLAIYPCIDPALKRIIIEQTDFYLDINYGPAMENELRQFVEKQIPIYSFVQTNHLGELEHPVYTTEELDSLVQEINQLRKEI